MEKKPKQLSLLLPESSVKPKQSPPKKLVDMTEDEYQRHVAVHGHTDQDFKDWLDSLPPGGKFRLGARRTH